MIGIIGVGNLGKALIAMLEPKYPLICSRRTEPLGINIICTTDNKEVARRASTIILSVKPYQIQEVCTEIRDLVSEETPIISVATAVPLATLYKWLPRSQTILRCMPNILCSIGHGVVPYYFHTSLRSASFLLKLQYTTLDELFAPNVMVECATEEELDYTTIISGCAPAFFAWYYDELQCHAQRSGILSPQMTKLLLTTTMQGTAIALQTLSPQEIMRMVASPKGATEVALTTLHTADPIISEALTTATNRVHTLRTLL